MKKFLLLVLIFLTAGVFVAMGTPASAQFAQSPALEKFIQPLRGLGPGGIPVAASDGTRPWPGVTATHYTIDIGQFTDKLHRDLDPTTLWGYNPSMALGGGIQPPKHLGGIIVAEKGKPVQITFQNNLPDTHILPVDITIPGAEQAQNRTATHLHGGLVPWISDGGPFDWWTPTGEHGASFKNNEVLNPGAALNEAEYYYPNNQSARFVWYHDHAYGITRLNAYAGIASAYVITDWYETLLSKFPFSIPGPLDARTLYLVFQDKIFYTGSNDPDYPVTTAKSGDLWYAHKYDPDRWTLQPNAPKALPATSVIAEFFGDTILVNGSVYPYVEVEQREYRLRMLNACNARFLNPRIVKAKSNDLNSPDSKEPLTYNPNPATVTGFVQIASEGGYLPYPAYLNSPGRPQLLMAPAERTDLIVDFRNLAPGVYLLYNDASAPYPAGADVNDYYTGNPLNTASGTAGAGPNTRTLLQIRVKAKDKTFKPNLPIWVPPFFTPTDPFLIFQKPGVPAPVPVVNAQGKAQVTLWTTRKVMATVRQLTLNEAFDQYGRLVQFLGTNVEPVPGQGFGRDYMSPPTEIAGNGTYEIWEIFNLTGDTHPMHFHLVNVQVLNRQNFNANIYNGTPTFTSIPFPPDANELGYKETVRINPNQVTRVLMKVDLGKVPFDVPTSPRIAIPAGATKAHEFVWHCHILEHEEHDMMRPFVVFE